MIDWIPIVLVTFKLLVFGTGMFFAIKWHYDKEEKEYDKLAVLRVGGQVAAVFVVSLLSLALLTFTLARKIGLDLTLP